MQEAFLDISPCFSQGCKVKVGIKLDSEVMGLIALFEQMTGAKVRDCIIEDKVIFVIEENDMGKAIGKNGANIKNLEFKLKKKIKLVEHAHHVEKFVRSFLHPLEVAEIREDNGVVTVNGRDSQTRAMIIGRERSNVKNLLEIAKRYYNINEIKVV
jgi:transcription termination/antitermination protein NusA